MRIVIACLGICLLAAFTSPAQAQNRRHERTTSLNPPQTSASRSERSRVESPEMLIFRRAQHRAKLRTARIEARKNLGVSMLRPGPIRYVLWPDPFHPVYPFNTLVYVQGF